MVVTRELETQPRAVGSKSCKDEERTSTGRLNQMEEEARLQPFHKMTIEKD